MNSQQRQERIKLLQKEIDELKSSEKEEKIKNLSHLVGKCIKRSSNEYHMILGIDTVGTRIFEYWALRIWWQKTKHEEFWLAAIQTGCRYIINIDEIEKMTIPNSRFLKKLQECTRHLNEMADKIASENDAAVQNKQD